MRYRVVSDEIPAGAMCYSDLYGDCPRSFASRAEAEAWAKKLSTSGNWPDGEQVTYHVEEDKEDL